MWVEEISRCGLGTVTSRGCSVSLNRRASGARPITTARSTSTSSPFEISSRATGTVTSGAGGCPGMPGGSAGGGCQAPATVSPSWSYSGVSGTGVSGIGAVSGPSGIGGSTGAGGGGGGRVGGSGFQAGGSGDRTGTTSSLPRARPSSSRSSAGSGNSRS